MKSTVFIIVISIIGFWNSVYAQQAFGLSIGYDYFPSRELVDPIQGAPGLKIQARSLRIGAALPFSAYDGKIIVLNQLNYKRTNLKYKNYPEDDNAKIDLIHEITYTAFMIDSLSASWKLAAVLTPGLASDFVSDFSADDFTLAAILGMIWTASKTFDLGFGLAYTHDFGEPLPLPFIYLDWKIKPDLSLNAILPANMNLVYIINTKMDLGLLLNISGNRYHGDPDKFGVDTPIMKYSEGTIGPFIQYHFSQILHFNIGAGFAFYRNFEFYNKDDKAQSFDLKQTGYISANFIVGI